jgi:hypothetical protein
METMERRSTAGSRATDRRARVQGLGQRLLSLAAATALVALVAACSSGSAGSGVALGDPQSPGDAVAPDYPIAYIKRTLPAANDPNAKPLVDDLRVQRVWNGPADVWVRDRAAPSAAERNITVAVTNGTWDVRDLATSWDGKKLIFAMRPPLIPNAPQSQQPKWRLYEYVLASNDLHPVITDPITADAGHDVAPQYLPDGRIVFSSTRQRDAKAVLIDEGKPQFAAGIEGNRNRPAFNLHIMNGDGSNIRQLSFNTGHDLNPTVLTDGRIMFSRWDIRAQAGMHLYTIKPDGSELQLLYGRNSHDTGSPGSTIQFVQPLARPDGKVVALMRPFDNTEFGGDPVLIDVANFVEDTQTIAASAGTAGPAQNRMVVNNVLTLGAPDGSPAGTPPPPSPGGRYASVYPLWDGTNRLLVSWTQCRLIDATQLVPCTTDELNKAGVQTAPPIYGIFIYNPADNTQQPVVAPVEGMMFTEAVAFQPRTPAPPQIVDPIPGIDFDIVLQAEGVGILDIRSIYDFDGVDASQAGITVLRDPTRTPPAQRPARFLRIEKAVSLPDREVLSNDQLPGYAFGVAGFMRELIGYAPVEPDGSVRVKVPAHVPLMITVLDANGRRLGNFPKHENWLQVRVGEVVQCNGCHVQQAGQNGARPLSHGRPGLFTSANPGAPATGAAFPGTALQVPDRTGVLQPATVLPNQGETMAQYRARAQLTCLQQPCAPSPSIDVRFDDVWSATPAPSFSYSYAALATPSPATAPCLPTWSATCRGVIHYPIHVAPMWVRARQVLAADGVTVVADHTCTTCHSRVNAQAQAQVPAGQLDLTPSPGVINQLELNSFEQLLFPHDALQLNMGALEPVPGPPDPVTGASTTVQAQPPMSGAGANASTLFFERFATGGSHAGWLDPAELRLLSEWLDLGGAYYNDPFAVPAP